MIMLNTMEMMGDICVRRVSHACSGVPTHETHHVEKNVHAVGLGGKGDECGGHGHRVDRAGLDDDAQQGRECARVQKSEALSLDSPYSECE